MDKEEPNMPHNTDGRGKKGHYYTTNENRGRKEERMDAEEIRSLVAKGRSLFLQQEP